MSQIELSFARRSFVIVVVLCLAAFFMGCVTTKKMATHAYSALALAGLFALILKWRVDLGVRVPKALKIWCLLGVSLWLIAVLSWGVNGFDEKQARSLSSPYGKLLLFPLVSVALSCLLCIRWAKLHTTLFFLLFLGVVCSGLLGADSRWGWFGLVPITSRAWFAVNPIYYGDLCLCMGFVNGLFSIYFLSQKKISFSILGIFGLLMGCLGSAISLSRGGWLALPVFILVAIFYLLYIKQVKFLILGFFMFFMSVLFTLFTDNALKERVVEGYYQVQEFDVDSSRTSVGYRLRMWNYAMDSFREKSLLGRGPMSYQFKDYDTKGNVIMHFDHAHNGYLQSLTTLGVGGLLIYLALFLYPLIYFIRQRIHAMHSSLVGVIVVSSFMVFDLTDVIFYRSIGLVFFLIVIGLCILLVEKQIQENKIQ